MNLLCQNFLLHLSVYELESVLPAFVHPTYSLFTLYIWKSCPGRPRFGRWTKINVKYYWIISTFWCKRRSLNGTGSYHLTCVPHWKKKRFSDSVLLSFSTVLLTFLLFKRFLWNGTGNYWLSVDIPPCSLVQNHSFIYIRFCSFSWRVE